MTEYIVYCEKDNTWFPRAIFVPIYKISAELSGILSLQEEICSEIKINGSGSELNKYIMNDIIYSPHEIRKILEPWSIILHSADHDYTDYCTSHGYLFYYIADENRKLSPAMLRKKLLDMKEYRGHDIVVKRCFLVYETCCNCNLY